MEKFIKTADENTASNLRMSGYFEIQKEGDFYVFLNEPKKAAFDESEVIYTNTLTF